MKYVRQGFFKNVNWEKLPVGTRVDVSNPKNTEYSNRSYHWIIFEKQSQNTWKMVQIWFISVYPPKYNDIESEQIFTDNQMKELNDYDFNIKLIFPLYKENGDINVFEREDESDFANHTYNDYSLLSLLKNVESKKASIRFVLLDNNRVNAVILQGGRIFCIKIDEDDFDEFCEKHNIEIYKDYYF